MNKIHSLQQLQIEKGRLQNRIKELELEIKSSWFQLKHDMDPINIAKETYNEYITKKIEKKLQNENLIDKTLSYGISFLANKTIGLMNKKLTKIFSK